ncbi:MAG TPA: L-2-amino-thiazoline-4-carboxylic acid hydrolase [Thermotogota bacterium]|nr:L-2-amino-thiazoline-4-carboxylic acid hydrolase [Thermotogota bacterium]
MDFQRTEFPYFYQDCIDCYGDTQGYQIYEKAVSKLNKMKFHADYRNHKAIRIHMDQNILPLIAIYQSYREFGLNRETAYENALRIAQTGALRKKEKNAHLGKLPFGYQLFKLFCKPVVKRSYPNAGWEVDWKCYDHREIHFDMKSCIYVETTKKLHCPELCPVFCANDITLFSGYAPSVLFERSRTIAEGYTVCDFHFKNGRKPQTVT